METQRISYEEYRKKNPNFNLKRAELKKSTYKDNDRKFTPSAFSQRMRYVKPTAVKLPIKLTPIPGESPFYRNWQSAVKIKGKGFRVAQCNCGNGDKMLPCNPCAHAVEAGLPEFLPKQKFAITYTILEFFHKIPVFSTKDASKLAYYKFELCAKAHGADVPCPHCDNNVPRIFGKKFYWNPGSRHYAQIMAIMDKVGKECGNCGGELYYEDFVCPECGESVLFDDNTDAEFYLDNDLACQSCGKVVRAKEVLGCRRTKGSGSSARIMPGCDKPTKINPWDYVWPLFTEGTGTDTSVNADTANAEHIDDFLETLASNADIKQAIDESSTEHTSVFNKQGELYTPMDFDSFLRAQSLEEQSSLLMIPNYFTDDAEELLNLTADSTTNDADSEAK